MNSSKETVLSVLDRSRLPNGIKVFFKGRIEREGVTLGIAQNIQDMLAILRRDAAMQAGANLNAQSAELAEAESVLEQELQAATEEYKSTMQNLSQRVQDIGRQTVKELKRLELSAIKQTLAEA